MSKISKQEQNEAREWLLKHLKPGDVVYTSLRHVSRSGMYRAIDLFTFEDNQPLRLSWMAAKLLEGYSVKHEACNASGCGMDMGFHLVYNLGAILFPDGFTCIGDHCPANDHSNMPYPNRDGQMWHNSGGYALIQKWL